MNGRVLKRVVAACACAIAVLAAVPAYVLGVAFGVWQPFTRPPGVPRSARYVSSIEDGTWFDCFVDTAKDVDSCRAWSHSGRLIASGDFRFEDEDRAATAAELRPSSVVSGDGHAYTISIFGKNGACPRALVPITREHPHTGPCKWIASLNKLSCQ